ncbi:MAG: SsrA-binding protein SmpB [Clostridiales bacterium]|nr:SsrA-binding protein SmpB [Clostridiales bacterium]
MDREYQLVAQNKKAYHDYFVLETLESGLELFGTEVKSIRQGRVNLKEAWCGVENGEMFVHGMHIAPFEQGNVFNRDPMRKKKLLLHKKQIMRLYGESKQDGLAIIPLKLYFSGSYAKLSIGLCKGKKNYDKRAAIAQKTAQREMERSLREKNR